MSAGASLALLQAALVAYMFMIGLCIGSIPSVTVHDANGVTFRGVWFCDVAARIQDSLPN